VDTDGATDAEGEVRRGTGIALTASALSITIGSNSRANSATPDAIVSSAPAGSDAVAGSLDPAVSQAEVFISVAGVASTALPTPVMSPTVVTPVTPAVQPTAKPTPTTKPKPRPAAVGPTTPKRSATPRLIYTTIIVTPITTAAPPPTTSAVPPAPTPPAPTVRSAPSTTAKPSLGTAVPGELCHRLGDKATVAQGWNVFCQSNFALGSLTWRPVMDGGGCLSKRMSGIGVDGRAYVCRPDGQQMDRWRPAH
jgi:hypothetical protein